MEKDKLLHVVVSTVLVVIITGVSTIILDTLSALAVGIVITAIIGLFKEVCDIKIRKTNTLQESMRDYSADIIGIAIGIVVTYILFTM